MSKICEKSSSSLYRIVSSSQQSPNIRLIITPVTLRTIHHIPIMHAPIEPPHPLYHPHRTISSSQQFQNLESRKIPTPTKGSPLEKHNNFPNSQNTTLETRWLFRKDILNLQNIGWLIFLFFISLSILSTCIFLTLIRVKQVNLLKTNLQIGKFVGDECKTSLDCLENAFCDPNLKRCRCVSDFYYDHSNGVCAALKSFDRNCAQSRECDRLNNLECVENVCVCGGSSVWANYYGSYGCVRQRLVGETCQSSSHCILNSACVTINSESRCQCSFDYYLNGNSECLRKLEINEECHGYFNECPLLTSCRAINSDSLTRCFCLPDYYYDAFTKSCVKLKNFNETCKESVECQSVNLVCLSKRCQCASGQYWNGTWCVDYSIYGQLCTSQLECNPIDANLICNVPPGATLLGNSTQKICYCRSGFYFNEYLSKCSKYKSVNEDCSNSADCIVNSICIDDTQVCQCMIGFYFDPAESACVRMLTYARQCKQANQCDNLVGLTCVSERCRCLSDYFWNGKKCELTNTLAETCKIYNAYDSCRLSKNLICNAVSFKCTCRAGFTLTNNNQCV